jgi:hypothetical protein
MAEAGESGQECWLCRRPLGRRVEWHHPLPRSRGGRDTVPVHPICHQAIHVNFSNAELARLSGGPALLRDRPEMARFLRWIAAKPPDFHARTSRRRG